MSDIRNKLYDLAEYEMYAKIISNASNNMKYQTQEAQREGMDEKTAKNIDDMRLDIEEQCKIRNQQRADIPSFGQALIDTIKDSAIAQKLHSPQQPLCDTTENFIVS